MNRLMLPSVAWLLHLVVTATAWATPAGGGRENLTGSQPPPGGIWLDTLDLTAMRTPFGRATAGKTITGNPLSVGGTKYVRGVGTHADSEMTIDLGGVVDRFVADVGVDDELRCLASMNAPRQAAVRFKVFADGRLVADSDVVRSGDPPRRLSANVNGRRELRLVVEKERQARFNHVDWAGAALVMTAGTTRKPIGVLPVGAPATPLPPPALPAADQMALQADAAPPSGVWLDSLDLSAAFAPAGAPARAKTVEDQPIQIGDTSYRHGIGVKGETEVRIDLAGAAIRFVARAGLDTGFHCGKVLTGGGGHFEAWVDGRRVLHTPQLHGWDAPVAVSIDLRGAKELLLATRGDANLMAWAGALLLMNPAMPVRPRVVAAPPAEPAAIARTRPDELGIHGPRVVGASPCRPFVFRVPATGRKPLTYAAISLPAGLAMDPRTGVISGGIKKAGRYAAELTVTDATGARAQRPLTIVVAPHQLALTPPMGWTSGPVWGPAVEQTQVEAAADALVATGLAAHGFSYVMVDDGWAGSRNAAGDVVPNRKFPDMKTLADGLHDRGLKLGLTSSPGPRTCAGLEGSYQHEQQDARAFARWGVDYLRYDWCSYGEVIEQRDLPALQRPYRSMSEALRHSGRDVVFALSQHGMGEVWKWGRDVGGHLWRTTRPVRRAWGSIEHVGFSQIGKEPHGGPGGWNDPDQLCVGTAGNGRGPGGSPLGRGLSQQEQVTQVTLWSLLAAPLFVGSDLTSLDAFTVDLLTNDEVLDVDQDPLGKQASRKVQDGVLEVWTRPLSDGTLAVGVFNRGLRAENVTVRWDEIGLSGSQPVRDLWLRAERGTFRDAWTTRVPVHGAVLVKVGRPVPP